LSQFTPASTSAILSTPKTRVRAMPDQNDDKREMRMMWIFTAAVVLLIVVAMGINVLVHHDTNAATPETIQLPTEPPK
jgi:hypothetical protein